MARTTGKDDDDGKDDDSEDNGNKTVMTAGMCVFLASGYVVGYCNA
jgi:hypothetical protein